MCLIYLPTWLYILTENVYVLTTVLYLLATHSYIDATNLHNSPSIYIDTTLFLPASSLMFVHVFYVE